MKVFINHKPVETDTVSNLAELLSRENLVMPGTAVAVDNKVVARDLWPATPLTDGMKITVIRAVCGG